MTAPLSNSASSSRVADTASSHVATAIKMPNLKAKSVELKAEVKSVKTFMLLNPDKLNFIELDAFQQKLEKTVKEIRGSEKNILAFFRNIFMPQVRREKFSKAQELESLTNVIQAIKDAGPRSKQAISTSDFPQSTVGSSSSDTQQAKSSKVIKGTAGTINEEKEEEKSHTASDSKETTRSVDQAVEDEIFGKVENSTHTTQETSSSPSNSSEIPSNDGPPPPPPPSGGPPPPPPPGGFAAKQSQPKLTPEQKYYRAENAKQQRQLKDRANPEKFYRTSPPDQEKELTAAKTQREKTIGNYVKLLNHKDVPENLSKTLLVMKNEEEEEIKKLNINLQPKLEAIPSKSANGTSSEFLDRAAVYTNDELQLLIGLYFEGKPPQEGHDFFKYYTQNKNVLDQIFNNWNAISTIPTAAEFLKHKDGWIKYISGNTFAFMDTFKKRLSTKNPLPNPTYNIPPFDPKASPSSKKSAEDKPTQTGPEPVDMMEDLKRRQLERQNKQPVDVSQIEKNKTTPKQEELTELQKKMQKRKQDLQ